MSIGVLSCTALMIAGLFAALPTNWSAASGSGAAASSSLQTSLVHLDPETGELLDAPPDSSSVLATPSSLLARDYSLFETTEVPGIGTYVHFGDDFQMVSWAEIDADGDARHECHSTLATSRPGEMPQ